MDWQGQLEAPIFIEVASHDVSAEVRPNVVSLAIRVSPPKTFSWFFEPIGGSGSPFALWGGPADEAAGGRFNNRLRGGAKTGSKRSGTRIEPPRDIVKFADRLFYLLQPPLETLLAGNTIVLPLEPFDFQYSGVAFLFARHQAVLADEMGLGKTMQAITTIRLLLRSGTIRSVLVVCPKPLVTNWQRELALWAPEIPVAAVCGNQARRKWHWQEDGTPIKIANYELLVRDERIVTQLDRPFDLVVIDEAQRIKNKGSATACVVRQIQRHRSWALTGTPIENSIDDLFGIFEFVSPGSLSPAMSHRELRNELGDYVLRRTKDAVIDDMPAKLIRDTELSLTEEQADTYQQAETDGVIRLTDMGDEMTIKHVFELVLRLKQICNFDPLTGASSKMEMLAADMEEVAASGQKAIVFSQWVGTLDRIAGQLQQFNPLAFHGRIPSNKRDQVLAEFQHSADRHVLLMSYGAGAVGLNLQFCRYVYLFDRWWNPAVEDQAINRAHRIGATGSVTVTRMIMVGTIEQRIHEILEAKRELFSEILSDRGESVNRGLTREEIFGLFDLRTAQGTIAA